MARAVRVSFGPVCLFANEAAGVAQRQSTAFVKQFSLDSLSKKHRKTAINRVLKISSGLIRESTPPLIREYQFGNLDGAPLSHRSQARILGVATHSRNDSELRRR
jgi:hypothetical protein